MKKSKLYKICMVIILLLLTFGISDSEDINTTQNNQFYSGINGKVITKAWKSVTKTKFIKNIKGWKLFKSCHPKIIPFSDDLSQIRNSDEILPKINKYLQESKPNHNEVKTITCFKNDANEVRVYLHEGKDNTPKLNKLIKGTNNVFKLAEYDIQSMQEYFYTQNGIEYVNFIIPKRPQYILNGKYDGRLYECMIFNIPKDIEGGWQKFKEYLIAFFNDIMQRPGQLWDEYSFRKGLSQLNITPRDVNEIEQYIFAKNNHNENIQHIKKEIA